jgi:hypothetical protein
MFQYFVKHYTHCIKIFDVKKERKLGESRCFWSKTSFTMGGRMVVSLDASFSDVYFHIKSSGGVIESAKVKARLPIRMLQC